MTFGIELALVIQGEVGVSCTINALTTAVAKPGHEIRRRALPTGRRALRRFKMRDARLVQAINALGSAKPGHQTRRRQINRQITRLETEMRFIKYFGGAAGLAVIGLIIERIAGVV